MSTGSRPAPPHWLRHNAVTRLPRRWVTLDTEAHRARTGATEVQTFRLGVTAFDWQASKGDPWHPTEWGQHTDPASLWRWVLDRAKPGATTVVLAHNLAYDLRIGQAFTELPALGYRCDVIRLDAGATWALWSGPRGTIKMVDTVSWFGVGLAELGKLLGSPKPALPDEADDDRVWFDRCRADVDILRLAWGCVLDWLEAGDMGVWKPTGAGQGWATFRHRHMTTPILHHSMTGIAAHEREAAWAGRCEAWRHGRLPGARWTEYDYRNAYVAVALDGAVPVRLREHLGAKGAQRAVCGDVEGTALVRARIVQPFPVAPARGPHGILWPVGPAAGWWWADELAAVVALGGTVEAVEGWRYDTAPALAGWARWVLDTLDAASSPAERVCALVVKGWSRTLVGRFGARWSEWETFGASPSPGVWLGALVDGDTGEARRMLSLGDVATVETERRDAPDSVPAVMSWVMAQTRLRLLAAMLAAGIEHVAYVDTDGLLVDRAGEEALDAAELPGLRVKSRWSRVDVLGPRRIVLDGRLRAAGVPGAARRVGPRSWEGVVWESLAAGARRGEVGSVSLRDRTWRLTGTDRRRAHLAGGGTAAFTLS